MFQHVFVAGTFDRLHLGHQAVLKRALAIGQKVTIGITSDQFISQYKVAANVPILSFSDRKQTLVAWVGENKQPDRIIEIIPIDDPYEPAVSDLTVQALVVTNQNISVGEEINAKRQLKGLEPLVLLEVDLVSADDQQLLSSTRIRNGEVTRDGRLIMPESLREALKVPFGRLLTNQTMITDSLIAYKNQQIITVGDRTTFTARQLGILPLLSVIDLQVERQQYKALPDFQFPETTAIVSFVSGPGFIASEVINWIKAWENNADVNPTVLLIDGEDDLVTLPLAAYVSRPCILYYGQPGEGVVEVVMNESVQLRAKRLLEQFQE